MKKFLIICMALLFTNISIIFAYTFEEKKTFTEKQFDNGSKEIEWYDENEYPYRVKIRDEDYDTTEYEYYNCDDYNDWIEKGNEIKKTNNKATSQPSTTTAQSNSTYSDNTSSFNVDPNVFYGKKKEECQEEEFLYRSVYYMKPINSARIGDINSASQYYYDDTKTAYYYPIKKDGNMNKFIVLVQDGFSELGQSVFIIDQCEFTKDELGNWVLVQAVSEQKDKETFAKAYSDENMLIKMLNARLKGYKSDETIKSVMFACINNNINDTTSFAGIYKSDKQVKEKEDYYMQHPQENPVNDGLNVHLFLTSYGKNVKGYLEQVYNALESWNNGTGNGYVVKSYWDVAMSVYSTMVDLGVQYKMAYGPNNLEYLRIKQDIGYLHNHFLTISKITGFRYP